MKKNFKRTNSTTKLNTPKILAAIFTTAISVQTSCMNAHADYNMLMATLYTVPYTTVGGISRVVESDPSMVTEIDYDNKHTKTTVYYALCEGKNTKENRVAIAKYLIQKGAAADVMSHFIPSRAYPYVWALDNGMYEFASWLIRLPGFKFAKCGKSDPSIVYYAAKYGAINDLEYICRQKRNLFNDINRAKSWETPLLVAAENNKTRTVKWLVDHGANVNVCFAGSTPLGLAVEKNNIEMVRYLVTHGANISVDGEPIKLAQKMGYQDIVRFMIDCISRDPKFREQARTADPTTGDTPLHLAAKKGSKLEIISLIRSGANVNAKNKLGQTPLHLAANNRFEGDAQAKIAELTKCNADPNVRDNENKTPLHYAAEKYGAKRITSLLTSGADPNLKNNNGETPLHIAVINRMEDNVEALISDTRTNINAADNKGHTPLDVCHSSGIHDMLKRKGAVNNKGVLGKGLLKIIRHL